MPLFRTAPKAEDKCFCKYYKDCLSFLHEALLFSNECICTKDLPITSDILEILSKLQFEIIFKYNKYM